MAGIAQEKPKPYFHCGPSMESGFGKSHTDTQKKNLINKFKSYLP